MSKNYEIKYDSPDVTEDTTVTLTLTSKYKGLIAETLDIPIKIKKIVPPTDITTDIQNADIESGGTSEFNITIPDNTELNYSLTPNIGKIMVTEVK